MNDKLIYVRSYRDRTSKYVIIETSRCSSSHLYPLINSDHVYLMRIPDKGEHHILRFAKTEVGSNIIIIININSKKESNTLKINMFNNGISFIHLSEKNNLWTIIDYVDCYILPYRMTSVLLKDE